MTKISAVIPDDLGAALKERAQAEDRSVGAVVRRALTEHVLHPVGPVESRNADAAIKPGHGLSREQASGRHGVRLAAHPLSC